MLAILAALASPAASAEPLQQRMDALEALIETVEERTLQDTDLQDYSPQLQAQFERLRSAGDLEEQLQAGSEEQVQALFDLICDYALAARDPSAIDLLQRIAEVRTLNGWAQSADDAWIDRLKLTLDPASRGALVQADSALSRQGRGVLDVANDGSAWLPAEIDMTGFDGVIAIGHPNCGFSQQAVNALRQNETYRKDMADSTVWLIDPWALGDIGAVAEWNASQPRFSFRAIDDLTQWPEINYLGTPSFYFFRDGETVGKMIGWRENESATKLEQFETNFAKTQGMPHE